MLAEGFRRDTGFICFRACQCSNRISATLRDGALRVLSRAILMARLRRGRPVAVGDIAGVYLQLAVVQAALVATAAKAQRFMRTACHAAMAATGTSTAFDQIVAVVMPASPATVSAPKVPCGWR